MFHSKRHWHGIPSVGDTTVPSVWKPFALHGPWANPSEWPVKGPHSNRSSAKALHLKSRSLLVCWRAECYWDFLFELSKTEITSFILAFRFDKNKQRQKKTQTNKFDPENFSHLSPVIYFHLFFKTTQATVRGPIQRQEEVGLRLHTAPHLRLLLVGQTGDLWLKTGCWVWSNYSVTKRENMFVCVLYLKKYQNKILDLSSNIIGGLPCINKTHKSNMELDAKLHQHIQNSSFMHPGTLRTGRFRPRDQMRRDFLGNGSTLWEEFQTSFVEVRQHPVQVAIDLKEVGSSPFFCTKIYVQVGSHLHSTSAFGVRWTDRPFCRIGSTEVRRVESGLERHHAWRRINGQWMTWKVATFDFWSYHMLPVFLFSNLIVISEISYLVFTIFTSCLFYCLSMFKCTNMYIS